MLHIMGLPDSSLAENPRNRVEASPELLLLDMAPLWKPVSISRERLVAQHTYRDHVLLRGSGDLCGGCTLKLSVGGSGLRTQFELSLTLLSVTLRAWLVRFETPHLNPLRLTMETLLQE